MLGTVVAYPEEVYPLVKLKLAADRIRRQIPAEPHWAFSYSMLQKVSRSFALVIQQLDPQLRNAVRPFLFLPTPSISLIPPFFGCESSVSCPRVIVYPISSLDMRQLLL
ncbi:hypothetical protein BHE74_00051473 [Ensete ventricosum]|nr:hypothetical protein GW17_00000195 [Ensete ventricosum]RWW42922.1 hypothetical protein BHE74_00051473 [Ensete ventricosum]